MICRDCPRDCKIDRSIMRGFCGEKDKIRVSKIIENFMWEEPCISGKKGALAIFFSGCNLRCKFCQNYKISHVGMGTEYSPKEFRKLLESYDLSKYECIDLITPSHFSSMLYEALKGFNKKIPIVWNSNGYEKLETINKISEFVDVFLVDFKYFDNKISTELSCCNNYFDIASKAIRLMSVIKPNIIKEKILIQGVLIRHLILPGYYKDSIKILDFIKKEIKDPFISIMSQFTPTKQSPIKRRVYPLEAKMVLEHATKIGLTDGYFQDLASSDENFIPVF